jgi:hypothetical protein
MEEISFTLEEPVMVVLTPQQVQIIIQALHEAPFKYANPVINHIVNACNEAKKAKPDAAE